MIVCSCAVLTEARVLATAEALAGQPPYRPVTAGRVFRAIIAEAGLAFTCPEPLGSEAGDQPSSAATTAAGQLTLATRQPNPSRK